MGRPTTGQFVQKCESAETVLSLVVGALCRGLGMVDMVFNLGDVVVAGGWALFVCSSC